MTQTWVKAKLYGYHSIILDLEIGSDFNCCLATEVISEAISSSFKDLKTKSDPKV